MSLIEPLLPKEEVKDQKLEKYSSDPLANLEKSIQELSVEFKSHEIDGTSDITFRNAESIEVKRLYGDEWKSWDIKCSATFENKLVISRIDGIIKIYDLGTKEETVLKGHSNAVNCLQVCIKQDFLVSGSSDKTIIIWNLKTYKEERVFKADNEVFCLIVTPGYNLFSGSLSESLIRKWNFWDENKTSTLSGHEDGVTCMKSSKNDQFLVTGSMDATLRIWSIESSQEHKCLNEHNGAICQIEVTEDNKYIVSVSNKRDIVIWNFNKGYMIRKMFFPWKVVLDINNASNNIIFKLQNEVAFFNIENQMREEGIQIKGNIEAIACSKKHNLVYYGLDNNTAQIADIKELNILEEFKDFDCKIIKMLLIGNNEEYLVSIMENGKIKIHEIYKENMQEDIVIDYFTKYHGIKLTRDEKYLILFNEKSLRIWNFIERKDVFLKENISLRDVKISYDDNYFVFNDDCILYLYSFQGMNEVAKFDVGKTEHSFCFSISKDSRFIAVGKNNESISVFDIENKSKAWTLEGLSNNDIRKLEITKANEYFISVDGEQDLIIWSFLEKKIIQKFHFDQEINHLKLNDKHNCVVVGLRSWIEILDFKKQTKIAKLQNDWIFCSRVEISDDEEYLLFTHDKGHTIWSFEYMKEIESGISNYHAKSLDITKDNKCILVGDDQNYVRLWSWEEKRFIANIGFYEFEIEFAKFIGDGKLIVVYNGEQIRIRNIEKYIDCNRNDSYLYFISGINDKIILQKFTKWMKSPSEYQWDNLFLDIVVYPIGYSVLHYLCLHDRADLLSIALKNGGEIFRDKQNMSPLSYALIRRSRRCIDEILNYAINLEDDKKQYFCIHQLRDDIPLLFTSKSPNLVPFLEVLFRRRADKDHVGFYEVNEELPMSIFSPISKIYPSAFTGENDNEKNESGKQNENLIQFWGSPWGYNYTVGSEESLLLLKKIDESQNENIFQTLIVQSIIREKWKYLLPAIITISIIYWLNLIMMIWHIFDPNIYALSSFIALNGILTLYEFLQFSTKPIDYVSEVWNLIDGIRVALSITWAILEFYDENIEMLSFAVVLFNFLRGLTYFRAFDFTRFYVRLILMALSDSFAFLIIFLYSTLAFGVLYASLNTTLSFGEMWTMAYELNMGNFDNDGYSFLQYSCFTLATLINVVMMLNLLVSTLGDTFDKFQMITDELDTKEMLQLVIEFESMMFWARSEQAKLRNKDKLLYLQRCDHFQDIDKPDKWQGKIKELSLKIDAVKDDILGNKKGSSEELKKLDENINGEFKRIDGKIITSQEKIEKSVNGKIEDMESKINGKVEAMESKMYGKVEDIESKISDIAKMLEMIKAKLDA